MKTYFRNPANPFEARTQANIANRAENLFAEGYHAYHCGNGVYGVYGPAGQAYTVNPVANECDCPAHAEHNDCKHRIGLALQLERELQAEADACEMDAETYRLWKEDNETRELIAA
jgi:hypothetical protein